MRRKENRSPTVVDAERPSWLNPAEETKSQRFYRIIEPRVGRCVKDIGLLVYGADRTRYEPSAQDICEMERVLMEAVDRLIAVYRSKKTMQTFRFSRLPEDGC